MKKILLRIFLWSWLVTLPVAIVGGVWFYDSLGRFYNYKVRYEPGPDSADLDLAPIGKYEIDRLLHMFGAYSSIHPMGEKTALKIIHLFVPEPNMAHLESH